MKATVFLTITSLAVLSAWATLGAAPATAPAATGNGLEVPFTTACAGACTSCGRLGHEHGSGEQVSTGHSCQDFTECDHAPCSSGGGDTTPNEPVGFHHHGDPLHHHGNRLARHSHDGAANVLPGHDGRVVANLERLRLGLRDSDNDAIRAAIEAGNGHIELVPERQAVQVVGCRGIVIAHYPLTPMQLAALD